MVIENRKDGKYIVTSETNDNGKIIVIKLDSEIENDLVYFHGKNGREVKISWKLKYNEKDSLHINLETFDDEFEKTAKIKVKEECISELVRMIKNSETLEDCYNINKAINECYNNLFREYLKDDYVICSDNIVEGIVEVNDSNKILGHGTRFVVNRNKIIICEYAGKEITKSLSPKINIHIDGTLIKIATKESIFNKEQEIFFDRDREILFSENEDIGYLKYYSTIIGTDISKCDLSYNKLNMPFEFTDKVSMVKYCIEHNTAEEITKYKIALRGKVKLINVNTFMIDEFLI